MKPTTPAIEEGVPAASRASYVYASAHRLISVVTSGVGSIDQCTFPHRDGTFGSGRRNDRLPCSKTWRARATNIVEFSGVRTTYSCGLVAGYVLANLQDADCTNPVIQSEPFRCEAIMSSADLSSNRARARRNCS
jgi:hypothetical protein